MRARLFFTLLMAALLVHCATGNQTEPGEDDNDGSGGSVGGNNPTGGAPMGGNATGGSGGSVADACADETVQLLISEITTQPSPEEFVEIWNPSTEAVDLSNYYLSDNSVYFGIAAGTAWMPMGTAQTDFLVQFPPGTSIAGGTVLSIEMSDGYEATYGTCPDLTVRSGVMCGGSPVPQMVTPTNGGLGTMTGSLLSNGGEMAVLFCWAGGSIVSDVDYVTWDSDVDPNTKIDKTGEPGYQDDTSPASQLPATAPGVSESIARCDSTENGETMSSGNGLNGHDETSESFNLSFTVLTTPSPGTINVCP